MKYAMTSHIRDNLHDFQIGAHTRPDEIFHGDTVRQKFITTRSVDASMPQTT